MASKKLTLFLVPDDAGRVRQLRVSRSLAGCLVAIISLSTMAFFWLIHSYSEISVKIPRLTELQRENALQKKEILHMAGKIDQFAQEMARLREMDHQLREMVNLETIEGDEQFRGIGGSDSSLLVPQKSAAQVNRGLVRAMHRFLQNLDSDIASSKEDKARLHDFLNNQKTLLACTPSIWPTKGWLSSSFGYRDSPFTGEKEFHKGIDISTRAGTPIVASADGVVSFVGWDQGYGRVVVIDHGYGFKTKYAHLKKYTVTKGQHVKRGKTIGLVGSSGRSTGSHLHYEVHLNGVAINPIRYVLR